MQVLGSSAGFEIARDGQLIWMAARGTRGPLLVALIAGGIGLLALVNGCIWSTRAFIGGEARTGLILAAALLGGGGLVATIGWLGFRAYRRRRDAPVTEMAAVRADLGSGELQTPSGGRVALLTEVRIDTPFNVGDSTQGSMRWVRLRWPGGSLRVYSAASKRAQQMASLLVIEGVGQRAT
jgi:hypothetical protein